MRGTTLLNDKSYGVDTIRMVCGKDGNDGACQDLNLSLPRNYYNAIDNTFRMDLFGRRNLVGSVVDCSTNGGWECYIQCHHDEACIMGTFKADQYGDINPLTVECNGERDTCSDMRLYSKDSLVIMKGASRDTHRALTLYAEQGWASMDLSSFRERRTVCFVETRKLRVTIILSTVHLLRLKINVHALRRW